MLSPVYTLPFVVFCSHLFSARALYTPWKMRANDDSDGVECPQNSQDKISKPRGKDYVQTEALLKTAMAQLHTENRDQPHKSRSGTCSYLRRHFHFLYSNIHFKLEKRKNYFQACSTFPLGENLKSNPESLN